MRVIKHGKSYHEIKCSECEAVFGYLDKEIVKKDSASVLGPDWSYEEYIKCPECEEHITLFLNINGEIIK